MRERYQILLVNPWIYDFAAVNLWSRPLGILRVAEALSAYNMQVHLIDCLDRFSLKRYCKGKYPKTYLPTPEILKGIPRRYSRYGIPEEEFIKKLGMFPEVDLIMVTGIMTYWYPGVQRTVEICRQMYPETPVVIGGVYPTLLPHHAERVTGADMIYQGRASQRLIESLRQLGLDLRQEGQGRPYYRMELYNNHPYAPLLTSEGCPFSCSYCASGLLWEGFRQRRWQEVVMEVKELIQMGVSDFAFYDDALLYRSERLLKPLLYSLKEVIEGLPEHRRPRFHTPNGLHARYMDAETARLMKATGFKTIRLGLETTDRTRQITTGGKVKTEELTEAVRHLKEAGFTKEEIGVYVMYGLPGQDIREVWDSVRFVISLGVRVHLTEFSPIPGTVEWKRLCEEGIIREDMDPLLTNNSVFWFFFSGLDPEEVKRLKDHVLAYNRLSS